MQQLSLRVELKSKRLSLKPLKGGMLSGLKALLVLIWDPHFATSAPQEATAQQISKYTTVLDSQSNFGSAV